MSSLVALFVVASTAYPAERDPIDFFIEGCVRGELRLPPGSVDIRSRNDPGSSTRFIRIKAPTTALIEIKTYSKPKRTGIESTCSLRSSAIKYSEAVKRLTAVLYGVGQPPIRHTQMKFGAYMPRYRYWAEVWRLRGEVVMRTTILEEKAAAAEAERQEKRALERDGPLLRKILESSHK